MKNALQFILVSALALGMAATAHAQDRELVPDAIESKDAKDGWKPRLSVGASLSFAHSDNVVGAQNGQTWNIGPSLDFGIDYHGGPHEWRNSLSVREVFTRTPVIDEFVKTVDTLNIESVYLYHPESIPELGPFVRATLATSIFPSTDVRATPVTYAIEGREDPVTDDRLDLTDGFAPLKLTQSVGMFYNPVTSPELNVDLRLGVGAREVFVQDGLAIADDDATAEVDVVQLQDFIQLGGEIYAGIHGTIVWEELGKSRPLLYKVGIESLLPFWSDPDDGKSGLDLTTLEINASLGIKLFSWMSLDYNLKVVREPLLIDDFQIQNNLLLNFSYTLIDG